MVGAVRRGRFQIRPLVIADTSVRNHMNPLKRKIGVGATYDALLRVYRPLLRLAVNAVLRRPRIDAKFSERLMLAVTEVNGCEACSWAHTRIALRKGFSREEIAGMLGGSGAGVPPEEAQGILFAQHYADSGGRPDRDAYEALLAAYGQDQSKDILASIQVMMAANMIGIPFSALVARTRGRAYPNSSLGYELGMHLVGLVILPVSLLHALVGWIRGMDNTRFSVTDLEGSRAS